MSKDNDEKAFTQKIVLRLDSRVPFEKQILDNYAALPLTRRQEWIRSVLRRGMGSGGGEPIEGSSKGVNSDFAASVGRVAREAESVSPKEIPKKEKSGSALKGMLESQT